MLKGIWVGWLGMVGGGPVLWNLQKGRLCCSMLQPKDLECMESKYTPKF